MMDLIVWIIGGAGVIIVVLGKMLLNAISANSALKKEQKATQTVTKARTEARSKTDTELDKEVDKWSRK